MRKIEKKFKKAFIDYEIRNLRELGISEKVIAIDTSTLITCFSPEDNYEKNLAKKILNGSSVVIYPPVLSELLGKSRNNLNFLDRNNFRILVPTEVSFETFNEKTQYFWKIFESNLKNYSGFNLSENDVEYLIYGYLEGTFLVTNDGNIRRMAYLLDLKYWDGYDTPIPQRRIDWGELK
ncbi:MAG: hypothetical protein QXU74_02770 [Candidatus Aenigmatarchaeota archaeon]